MFLLLPANFHNSHLISVCVPLKENGVVWCDLVWSATFLEGRYGYCLLIYLFIY